MALYVLPEKPTFGEMVGTSFGTGLSSGLSQSLQMLAKHKLDNLQKRNMYTSLLSANVPPNIASALVHAPSSMRREMFSPLLRLERNKINNLYKLKKRALGYLNDNNKLESFKERISQSGATAQEMDIIFGKELNDDMIRYFLNQTNNNPKKAKKLAKKFGFRV